MEHSYTRDYKPSTNDDDNERYAITAPRTILVERPPLCPSCHQLPPNHDEKVDTPETFNIPIPPYNEEAGRKTLNATEEMIKNCHNRNSDTDDWSENIQKYNWTEQQINLFERVERILDMDQLGRLAVSGLPNECLRRNAIIEKSVSRMRSALASVHWDTQLTSWIHGLLMSSLPPKYMVSYIDIIQTLNRKIPTLVDKMLFHKPIEMHKEYMNAIMKTPWEPTNVIKKRTLPNNPVIIILSTVCSTNTSSRDRRWAELLNSFADVETVTVNLKGSDLEKPIKQITETLVAMTRAKIQMVRNQRPNRHIILAGFAAGAAIAVQVAIVEPVNSIVCLGFAYNTLHGQRGKSDDRILELTTPILFVIGENAQKSSQEEIEAIRVRITAHTLLVIVGSSDDSLRVKRLNRSFSGVSQSMIDSMIMEEIQEFATNCILNPPGPRKPRPLYGLQEMKNHRAEMRETSRRERFNGKQKFKDYRPLKSKKKRPHILNGIQSKNKDPLLQMAVKSMLPHQNVQHCEDDNVKSNGTISGLGTPNVSPIKQKVKYIPPNQFLHIKPPPINTQKIYVKQQSGHQSYTLGVKNIGTSDGIIASDGGTVMVHNNSNGLNSPNHNNHIVANSKASEQNPMTNEAEEETINFFDIPILFADNHGNFIDTNPIDNEMPEEEVPKAAKSIEIISDKIIKRAIVDDLPTAEEQYTNEQNVNVEIIDKSAESPSKSPTMHSNGKFIILNKHTLNQFKTLKRLPSSKFKKVGYKSPNIRCFNSSGRLSSIDSKPRLMTGPKANISKFQNGNCHNPSHTNGISTAAKEIKILNGTSKMTTNGQITSQKSGILIKRKYMKNITIRKMNIVQSDNGDENYEKVSTKYDSKVNSIDSLIADLEN
ncbi:KAT8 regulatory NSL complex subunit 3-like isoform X2 [Contarinia nasturtii]|nr:KAT8 regulatory NSL complex subunit 3-like isoform X2 [Contarinia nasturtii]